MPDLPSMIGKRIIALVPMFHRTELQELTLHGVEAGGIWVESQMAIDMFLANIHSSASKDNDFLFAIPPNFLRFGFFRRTRFVRNKTRRKKVTFFGCCNI
jgi:hypothetical protein